MKYTLTILFIFLFGTIFGQTQQYIDISRRLTLAGYTVTGISKDTTTTLFDKDSLMTKKAVRTFLNNYVVGSSRTPFTTILQSSQGVRLFSEVDDSTLRAKTLIGGDRVTIDTNLVTNSAIINVDVIDPPGYWMPADTEILTDSSFWDYRDFYNDATRANPLRTTPWTVLTTRTSGPATVDNDTHTLDIPQYAGSGGTFEQVNADWLATDGPALILNKPNIPASDTSYWDYRDFFHDGTLQDPLRTVPWTAITDRTSGPTIIDNDAHTIDIPQYAGGGTGVDQVNSDWLATEGPALILNKPVIPTAEINTIQILQSDEGVRTIVGIDDTTFRSRTWVGDNHITFDTTSNPDQVYVSVNVTDDPGTWVPMDSLQSEVTNIINYYIDSSYYFNSVVNNIIDTTIINTINNYIDTSIYFATTVNNITNQYIDTSLYFSTVINNIIDSSVVNIVNNYIDTSLYFTNNVNNIVNNYIDTSVYLTTIINRVIDSSTHITNVIQNYIDTSVYFTTVINNIIDTTIINVVNNYIDTSLYFTTTINNIIDSSTHITNVIQNYLDTSLYVTNVINNYIDTSLYFSTVINNVVNNYIDTSIYFNTVVNNVVQNFIDTSIYFNTVVNNVINTYVDTSVYLTTVINRVIDSSTHITNVINNYIDSSYYFSSVVNNIFDTSIVNYIDTSVYFNTFVTNNISNYIDTSVYFSTVINNIFDTSIVNYIDTSIYFNSVVNNSFNNYIDTSIYFQQTINNYLDTSIVNIINNIIDTSSAINQNLQQVTDIGYETTNPIVANSFVATIDGTNVGSIQHIGLEGVRGGALTLKDQASSFQGQVYQSALTDNHYYTLPNADGMIALVGDIPTGGDITTIINNYFDTSSNVGGGEASDTSLIRFGIEDNTATEGRLFNTTGYALNIFSAATYFAMEDSIITIHGGNNAVFQVNQDNASMNTNAAIVETTPLQVRIVVPADGSLKVENIDHTDSVMEVLAIDEAGLVYKTTMTGTVYTAGSGIDITDGVISATGGGTGGGDQDLQSVTDVGNVTTDAIITGGLFVSDGSTTYVQAGIGGNGTLPRGILQLHDGDGGNDVVIQPANITAPRIQNLPDKSGTFAMLDDITGGGGSGMTGVDDNDFITHPYEINGHSATVFGNNAAATDEAYDESGYLNSVWFSWAAPASGTLTLNTSGSKFDTYLRIGRYIDGSFVETANNDDSFGGIKRSLIEGVSVTAETLYFISISGYPGGTGYEGPTGEYVLNILLQ